MNRRSFVMSIVGGIAAASVGGAAFAASRSSDVALPAGEIDGALKAGLDQTDADFNQVVIRERVVRRRPRRNVVVRRRVIVRRPIRRRRVVTRRVIVR